MTREGGKPLIENSDEVGWTAAAFDYYAEIGRDSAGRVIPSIESTQLALVVKEPIGVIACIVPWNYPLLLLAWKLAPALAAGNATVCKPSELTPLSTLMLAECLDHLPAGVVNIVAGAGDVGARIVADPRVDGVAFTGSVETGKRIAAVCAERVARINLEMGGKDPFIVCSDVGADVDVAAQGGAWAAFLNAGQVCTSAERFYVVSDVYDDYLQAFVDYTGGARDRRSDGRRDRSRADGLGRAAGEGARLSSTPRSGGRRDRDRRRRRGASTRPLPRPRGRDRRRGRDRPASRGDVRTGRSDRRGLVARRGDRARQLDPLRPRRQRLHARPATMLRCMREIKAGTVWFNDPLTDNDAGPFGGFKQSGLGRELGREGLEAFQETKHVHIETEIAPKEWWYPYGEGSGDAPPHGA